MFSLDIKNLSHGSEYIQMYIYNAYNEVISTSFLDSCLIYQIILELINT